MILYRYILKEHLLPFLYSLGILIFIFAMQLAVQMLPQIISKGLSVGVVLELFAINIAWVIALAIPMAILVSTLMVFGSMSGDNEIMAIKASGKNLPFLIVPVFLAACVLTVISVFFNNDILPDANHRAANLLTDISRKKPATFIEPGVLITSFENYGLFVKKVDPATGNLTNVKIFSNVPGEDPATTVADHGELTMTKDEKLLRLVLYNGETHRPSSKNKNDYFIGHFKRQVVFIKNIDSQFRRTSSSYRSDREMSSEMMLGEIKQYRSIESTYQKEYTASLDSARITCDSLEKIARACTQCTTSRDSFVDKIDTSTTFAAWLSSFSDSQKLPAHSEMQKKGSTTLRLDSQIRYEEQKVYSLMVEVYKKYSIPVACIVFVLIGAPLGIMARRGGIMVGASYSLFFFIIFWAFLITGEALADKMVITPFVAMWSADILIGFCGLILLAVMMRETKFISFSFVTKLFSVFSAKEKNADTATKRRGSLSKINDIFAFVWALPYKILGIIIGVLPSYLIRKFMGWFVGLLLVVFVVFVVVDWVSNLSRFEGASFFMVMKFYWYYLPWLAGFIVPIVILLASMSSIGSMVRLNELTAVKAAGISVSKLTFAMVLLGLILSGLGFYVGETILPKANMARRQLLETLNAEKAPKGTPTGPQEYRRNFYYFGDQRNIYHFDEFRTNPCMTRNVWRQTFNGSTVSQRVSAESATYIKDKWVFVNAIRRTFIKDSMVLATFDTLADTVLSQSPQDMVAQIKSPEEMSYWELASYVDKSRRRGEDVAKWDAQLDFKLALPLMNFIVMLLGISISARAGRKGGAVLFGIGLLLIFAFWIVSQFAISYAQNGQIPAMVGAWFGNVLFFIIAIPLYRRASL